MNHEVPMLNVHNETYNFRQRRAKLADAGSRLDLNSTAEVTLPEIRERFSLHKLGLGKLPEGIFLGSNGHFPIEELGNTAILRVIETSSGVEDLFVTEVPELIEPESPTKRLTRRFIRKHGLGTLIKMRDHHYAEVDRENEKRRHVRGVDKAIESASRRRGLKAKTSQEYLQAQEDAKEENWETHLQINSPVIDWSLFPDEKPVKTQFSEAELEELGQHYDEPDLSAEKQTK